MNQKTRAAKKLLAFFVLWIIAISFFGCERGCLMKEAREHAIIESPNAMTPMTRGQDCAPDLFRCRAGAIERSLVAFVPENCHGTMEQCTCPWMHVSDCDKGCAKDDVELVLQNDAGASQLCATPAGANAVIGGAIPEGATCDEPNDVGCVAGVVFRCETSAKLLATCTHGCAVRELPSDVDDRAAVNIACRR